MEESIQDSNAWLKFIIFTIPLFYIINLLANGKSIKSILLIILLTGLFLFGFMLKCTYNVRAGKNCVLPSFNIFSTIWLGIKGTVALAPLALLSYFVATQIAHLLTGIFPQGTLLNIFIWADYIICSSFVFTSYLLYIKNFKIFDAYNIGLILKYCIDVVFMVLFMLILIAIIDAIIVAPITYVIWLFLGIPNPFVIYFWCLIVVLNIAMIGHYIAQANYEIIPLGENESDVLNISTSNKDQTIQK